jgi:hypothetical protein
MATNYEKATRYGNKWTVNEILSLQREFELLCWSIDDIASNHKRTPNAIMFKLDQENLADYNVLYDNYHNLKAHIPINKETRQARPTETLLRGSSESSDDEDDENDEDYVDNADDEDEDDDDGDEDEIADLSERVTNLESGIYEIKKMLKSIISNSVPACGIKDCKMKSCANL